MEKLEIKNVKIGNLDTVVFDVKLNRQRKFQTYVTYPHSSLSKEKAIVIQSPKRIGRYYYETGVMIISAKDRPNGAYFIHLDFDPVREYQLTEKQKLELNLLLRLSDKPTKQTAVGHDNSGVRNIGI